MSQPQQTHRRKATIEKRMPWLAASEDLQAFLRTYSLVGMEDVIEKLVTNGLPSVVPVPVEDEEVPSQPAERPVDDRLLLANPLRFIGRSEELTWLLGQLEEAGTGGIVTLEGMGGIGKTALAAVAVQQVAEKGRFRDGIIVVHCENKTRVADVLREVLSRLVPLRTMPETTGEAELAEIAFRSLSGKSVLIVLDNVEPELAIEQVVAPLRAAGATLLLTARHALPLGQDSRRELGLLSAEEALELFAQSLGRTSAQSLGTGERAAAERIVTVLGHHTLAVKLAGAYAASAKRPLDALASELEQDPLHVSGDGLAFATELVFNRSVEQLPQSAKRLFAALAGFASLQFGRKATLALARDPSVAGSGSDVDLLIGRALVDSTLEVEMPEASDRERLRLHPLLRTLAAGLLALWPAEQREAVPRVLATFYAAYCPTVPDIALDADEANIEGALDWALQHDLDDVAATICLGMREYWNNRWQTRASLRYLPEGIKAAERVALRSGQRAGRLRVADIALAYAQTLRRVGNLGRASETLESNLAIRRAIQDRQGEGRVLSQLGLIARLRGQMSDAERYFMQSLAIRRDVHDRIGEGYDLSQLGQMAKTRGQLAEAERYFSESLALRRSVGDRAGEAGDLGYLGQIARLRGQLEVAEGYFQQSLEIARDIRYLRAEATALSQLGQLERARGDLRNAERYLMEALELRRQAQDARGQGFDLGLLGRIAQARGELSKAEDYFRQSLAMARNVEDRRGEAAVLSSLGQLGLARGQLAEAEHHLTQSLELRRTVQDRQGEGIDLSQFGRLYLDRGELEKAEQFFRESLAVDREIQDRPGEGVDLSQLGLVAIERGRPDEAQRLLEESLAIRREVQDPRGEGVDLALLGRIALERSKLAEAEDYYQQSLSIARHVNNRRGEGVNLCQLGVIAARQGDFERAERLIQESLAIAREVDNGLDIADAQSALGQLFIENRSQRDEGCSLLREAVRRYQEIGSPSGQKARETARRLGCGE
jgi:tetratricopeptide (TPR) repeat protein